VQTPEHVAILVEMNHDTRVIPLGGRPHLPAKIAQWTGDSRGRWEGDTLVVETRNLKFNQQSRFGVQYPKLANIPSGHRAEERAARQRQQPANGRDGSVEAALRAAARRSMLAVRQRDENDGRRP
jgi:hypothetical protein